MQPFCRETESRKINNRKLTEQDKKIPRKRIIGPEMPSRELLAASAELTKAEAELRDSDLEVVEDLLIGPPPPAIFAEVEFSNEAERFEEVTRIVYAEVDKPYDVLGINWKASIDRIKKRYWKLSLMVHPDKCSHPQAHHAFLILNQAFKDVQDPEKRKAIDEKINLKEEQEAFQTELKAMREAAHWRRLQGISLAGDDELLAFPKEESEAKRDEWMTQLPSERKPGMPVQSTSFCKNGKEGRGDTSLWTDIPHYKSKQPKQIYIEAYKKEKEAAAFDDHRKFKKSESDLVDRYNSVKRSKSLMEAHQESKKQRKKKLEANKKEWEGQHPWKPWDRENDLGAGRRSINLDSKGMAQGLSSRFSSGSTERNFL